MKKYRIIENKTYNYIYYTIEERNIWHQWKIVPSSYICNSLSGAQNFLEEVQYKKTRKVVG